MLTLQESNDLLRKTAQLQVAKRELKELREQLEKKEDYAAYLQSQVVKLQNKKAEK